MPWISIETRLDYGGEVFCTQREDRVFPSGEHYPSWSWRRDCPGFSPCSDNIWWLPMSLLLRALWNVKSDSVTSCSSVRAEPFPPTPIPPQHTLAPKPKRSVLCEDFQTSLYPFSIYLVPPGTRMPSWNATNVPDILLRVFSLYSHLSFSVYLHVQYLTWCCT